jgi:hypothetical protein
MSCGSLYSGCARWEVGPSVSSARNRLSSVRTPIGGRSLCVSRQSLRACSDPFLSSVSWSCVR